MDIKIENYEIKINEDTEIYIEDKEPESEEAVDGVAVKLCHTCFEPFKFFAFCETCDIKCVKCSFCTISFDTYEEFRNHLNVHPSYTDNNEKIVITSTIYLIKKFRENISSPIVFFTCQVCKLYFETVNGLMKHRTRTHEYADTKSKWKCHECNRYFSRESNLREHLTTHTLEAVHECELCGRKFHTKSKLQSHRTMLHASIGEFHCDICTRVYKSKPTLTRHRHSHTEGKLFPCNQCSKSFAYSCSLRRHIVDIHEKRLSEPSFECDICHIKIARKADLQRHIENHMNIQNFSCNVCNKTFSRKSNLKEHKISHGSTRKFLCNCGKSFKFKSGHARHILVCPKWVSSV